MSIENILKDLKEVKIYLKRNHLDAHDQLKIQYDRKNVINLDSDDNLKNGESEDLVACNETEV